MGNQNQSPTQENAMSPTPGGEQKKRNIFADTVPTSFMWSYGGRKAYLIGSFNEWREKIPLTYSPELEQFGVVLNLPQGRHFYRFIIDGNQKADPKQPLVKDTTGQRTPTNYVDVIKKSQKQQTTGTQKSSEREIPNSGSRTSSLKRIAGKSTSSTKTDENETTLTDSSENSVEKSPANSNRAKHNRTLSKPSDTEEGSPADFAESANQDPHIEHPQKSQAQKIRRKENDDNSQNNTPNSNLNDNTPNSQLSAQSPAQIRTQSRKQSTSSTLHERFPSSTSENLEEEEEDGDSLEEQTTLLTPKQHWINEMTARDYTQEERVFVETKKTMPIVPPHLKYTPLNSSKKYSHDTCLLPVPLHVTVNHAYMKKAPDMQVFGITQRFQGKYSTLLFFKPTDMS